MNPAIFVTHKQHREWYIALCQCGVPHGPYAKVALTPPGCPGCEQQALAKERKASA
jgi:hypothetical protein